MSDASLTNDQAQKLLRELSSNSGFRQRFQEKPAAALVELGIPHETVVNLNAACLAPMRLASPEVFQAALKSFAAEGGAQATLTMITPHLRLDAK
ncbi:NHLP-related RiPP peptide [Dokdonella fugitiva]|jgi:putative modified peptide|uniref:Putative modified peptide n=1 Tax=Dokdonella fugitiva TaxID=328517 RepID=A0A4R2IHV5_9GAMM|nr:NHLP-related RiPP peptide [Dokdonella fugitiva]MBA8882634.1 putative modified peptide [Dokdonella fugitiva]TCO43389.1 putative modified peptide [Dokdonella fugitiva]